MSKFIEVKTAYGNRMLVNLSKILRVYESEKGEPPVISLSDDWDIPLNETYDHSDLLPTRSLKQLKTEYLIAVLRLL